MATTQSNPMQQTSTPTLQSRPLGSIAPFIIATLVASFARDVIGLAGEALLVLLGAAVTSAMPRANGTRPGPAEVAFDTALLTSVAYAFGLPAPWSKWSAVFGALLALGGMLWIGRRATPTDQQAP